MEISEVILAQALKKSKSSSVNLELSIALMKLENKTLEDFLNGEKNQEMRTIDSEIRSIINTNVHHNRNEDVNKIDIIAQIIFTIKEYLQKGISYGDARAVLIFLSVNCYLEMEIEKFFSKEELEESKTNPASEKIIKMLTSINFTTQILPDAPYHEKEMMNESISGFANNDIAKTYRMIESMERGGRGFHFNFLLENLLSFLYRINFTYFIKALSQLQNPTEFVFYMQGLKKEDLIKIANEPSLPNKWLNFEIIRQIVKKESKSDLNEFEQAAVKTTLDRIRINNFDFFKQTIKYFNRSKLFNASLGSLLVSLNNSQIEEVISDCFIIDKYTSNLNSIDSLREQFVKSSSDEQFDFLHALVFNKWKLYFDNILTTEDFYQNGLLITDFASFVVHYHTHLNDNNSLIAMMKNLMKKIEFIDSEWTSSSSQQITKFHLYHSELYLLTSAYRNKKLNEREILMSYDELINNHIHLSRYVSEETTNYLKRGRQNIDWMNEYVVEA